MTDELERIHYENSKDGLYLTLIRSMKILMESYENSKDGRMEMQERMEDRDEFLNPDEAEDAKESYEQS